MGKRISIIGPSCSGKSTLAVKLGQKLNLPVVHLDQLAHKPGTAWERKPIKEFVSDHDSAITESGWIVEGNYSICMPQRFAKADTVIWCDVSPLGCCWRYILRSLKSEKQRPGRLKGALREFNWGMIKYTLFGYPQKKPVYEKLVRDYPHLKVIKLTSFRQVKNFSGDKNDRL